MYTVPDLDDQETWEGLVRALEIGRGAPENRDVVSGEPAPQIVQLAGDDAEALAAAARRLAPYADGFDVNLGRSRGLCRVPPAPRTGGTLRGLPVRATGLAGGREYQYVVMLTSLGARS